MFPNPKKQTEDPLKLQDLFLISLSKWYWFVVSVLLAISLAVLYLMVTPPTYTRTASILIKDNAKGGASAANFTEFDDLGIFRSNSNVNNELITLKSPSLMQEVVIRLDLDKQYIVKQGMRKIDLYKKSPVLVTLKELGDHSLQFDIALLPNEKIKLSNFIKNEEEVEGEIECDLSDTVQTPAGVIMVIPTPHFTEWADFKEIQFVRSPMQNVVINYTNSLQVELESNDATVINLSIKDQSLQRADDILNTLIAVYNEEWINEKNWVAVSTSRFINERLSVIEQELGNVDRDISSYKSEHILPDVQAVSGMYLSQYAESGKELLALNNRLAIAKQILENLGNESVEQLLPSNSGIDNVVLERQIGEYNDLLLRRNSLLSNSSERNPLVVDMTKSLAEMRLAVIASVDNLIASLNTQIKGAKKHESRLTGQIASNPNQARYLLSVERQQKVKEALYLYLLQKREENELSQAFTAYNTRIITPPNGKLTPTAPVKRNILFAAFLVGMLVPVVIIFMRENMNTKVRGRKDLEKLSIPLIGEIPLFKHRGKKKGRKNRQQDDFKMVVEEGNRNIINESFRVLRFNIDFMVSKDSQQNVFILTSFNPGSGKSFLTVNIAMSFAIKKKKIVVIDGDMRHASVSACVGSPRKGLSDYLGNYLDKWEDVIVSDKMYENLHYLPIGTIPPNPTELLENGRMTKLIEVLRSKYDYVFIDCPPVDIVADTQIIEKLADRTIFVIRAGLMERTLLSDLESMYNEKRFKNLSMMLNGTENDANRYAYRYGYHGVKSI